MNRIESIDTVKGIAMLCVIILHTAINYPGNLYVGSCIHAFVTPFFMPVFFMITGMFFSTRLPFIDFIKKKFRRLVIPFISFYILTYLINLILFKFNISTKNGFRYSDIFQVFHQDVFSNNVIWFLLALFWSSIFLYLILKYIKSVFYQSLIILFLYMLGILLDKYHINIMLYVDTSLSVMPFLYIGYILKYYDLLNKISILSKYKLLFYGFLTGGGNFLFQQSISLVNNSCGNPLYFIIGSTLGCFFIIIFCFMIKKIFLLSYIGYNSMIVLCTHMFVINFFVKAINIFNITNLSIKITVVVFLVCVSMYLIVPFLRRYVPFLIGEK